MPVNSPGKNRSATITVCWGNDDVTASVHLTPRNWARIKAGKPLQISGKGYYYEGDFYQDFWNFEGGLDGGLLVTYTDCGVGFDGILREAEIEED